MTRRLDDRVAVAAEVAVALIVGHDEHDVGLWSGEGRGDDGEGQEASGGRNMAVPRRKAGRRSIAGGGGRVKGLVAEVDGGLREPGGCRNGGWAVWR